ncbi:sensor histidine kinase [Brevibacterium zhoupengii]|uniref:sensor histidine kinase n=1 Tax=Brevibacterium zhoupengii TaxID=2898795 RepID=UPI001E2CE1E8|nr:histidine kinase [Brevibacterium zhoupengii]
MEIGRSFSEPRHEQRGHSTSTPAPVGSWPGRHALFIDVLVIAAIFLYNLPIQFSSVPGHLWIGTGLVFSVGLCAPYLLRRRHPLPIFLTIFAVTVVQSASGIGPLVADVMLVLALYNLSSRYRWVVSVPATLAVVLLTLSATSGLRQAGYLNLGEIGVLIVLVMWAGTWGALVRIRRAHLESLREQTRQLAREAETQKQIAAAEERARIAREIHDVVSHSLSVVTVLADGAASTTESNPAQAKRAMEDVRDTGRSAMTEMRSMLDVLRSDDQAKHAPLPGIEQLDQLINESRAVGLPLNFEHRGKHDSLPEGLSLTVYRTVQEALTNIRKHAGTSVQKVRVVLEQTDTTIDIRIGDDGRGPNRDRGGHGLTGMRERVSAYGGILETGPLDPNGFEVHARFPIGEDS